MMVVFVYWICYWLCRFLSFVYFPRKILGYENVPRKGSFIVASNHLSNIDPFAVGMSTGHKMSHVAKDALFKNKILSYVLYCLGAFPIKRNQTDIRAMKETLRRLNSGQPVLIFPEGARQTDPTTSKIYPGIGLIARKTAVPIIPAFVKDSDKCLPPGSKWFKRRHKIIVIFGKALDYSLDDSNEEIAKKVMEAVVNLSA